MVVQWISLPEIRTADPTAPHIIDTLFEIDSPIVRSAEPYFAALGKEVRLTAVRLKTTWIRLALGEGTTEKIFAVVLGYAVVALSLAMYLNVLTVGNVKSAGRAVRGAVRQQLLVLKVP
jgi:E3 ubiquitin-protein ligase MARCH6